MRHNATGRRAAWTRMRETTPVVLVNGRHVLTPVESTWSVSQ
jgi:hypothetical protein